MISHTTPYEHPMLNTRMDVESRNALAVMEKADALFEVEYPAATWSSLTKWDDGTHPTIESGKN